MKIYDMAFVSQACHLEVEILINTLYIFTNLAGIPLSGAPSLPSRMGGVHGDDVVFL